MIGLTPCWPACLKSWIAPASDPWSVSPTAGISSSAARAASAGMRQAPSRIEYSEWTCRWTKSAANGRLILGRRQDAPGFASGYAHRWPRIVGRRRSLEGGLVATRHCFPAHPRRVPDRRRRRDRDGARHQGVEEPAHAHDRGPLRCLDRRRALRDHAGRRARARRRHIPRAPHRPYVRRVLAHRRLRSLGDGDQHRLADSRPAQLGRAQAREGARRRRCRGERRPRRPKRPRPSG